MATYAARRLTQMAGNAAGIVSIELLAAAQGLEFHRPLRSSAALEQAHREIRRVARAWRNDRFFAPDIAAVRALVLGGVLREIAGSGLFRTAGRSAAGA